MTEVNGKEMLTTESADPAQSQPQMVPLEDVQPIINELTMQRQMMSDRATNLSVQLQKIQKTQEEQAKKLDEAQKKAEENYKKLNVVKKELEDLKAKNSYADKQKPKPATGVGAAS